MVATPIILSICSNKGCGVIDFVGVTNICAKCFKESYINKIVRAEFNGRVYGSSNIYPSPIVAADSKRLSSMKMNKK